MKIGPNLFAFLPSVGHTIPFRFPIVHIIKCNGVQSCFGPQHLYHVFFFYRVKVAQFWNNIVNDRIFIQQFS